MAVWKKVLCAVDFSPCSRAALEAAARIAADGASLVLVHVFNPPRPATVAAGEMLTYAPPDPDARVLAEAERHMAEFGADAERIAGAGRVETRLVAGRPEEEVARLAASGGHDLVVVGTHGRTGFRRLMVGSVAEHIVRSVTVPVLVVRGADPAASEAA